MKKIYVLGLVAMLLLAIVPFVVAKTIVYKFPGNMLVTGNLEVKGVIKGSWYKQISWYDIINIPSGFKDGIDNTDDLVDSSELDNICDVDGKILKRVNGVWECSDVETTGLTDSSSYWLCTSNDCSDTCQVILENGLITDCVEPEVKTLILYPIEDALVVDSALTYNYGLYEELQVGFFGETLRRSYIMFDTKDIIGKNIIDAKVKLSGYTNNSIDVSIYDVMVYNWSEGSENGVYTEDSYEKNLTWANQPCGVNFDNSELCNLTVMNTSKVIVGYHWTEFNVLPSIKRIYNENKNNVSFVLKTDDELWQIHSKEYIADITLIPFLNITYIEYP